MAKFLTLIFGGNDKERNISLQSIRSFMENSIFSNVSQLVYMSQDFLFYFVNRFVVYSNNLQDLGSALENNVPMNILEFITMLRNNRESLVMSFVHGSLGEDGILHKLFEEHQVAFIGSPSKTMALTFDKYKFNEEMDKMQKKNIFFKLLSKYDLYSLIIMGREWKTGNKYILKPRSAGSSLGVQIIDNYDYLLKIIGDFWNNWGDGVLEEYYEGVEFSVAISGGKGENALPTKEENVVFILTQGIYSYKKKYMINNQVTYKYKMVNEILLASIIRSCQMIYKNLHCRGIVRIDGIIHGEQYIINDLNTIPAMDHNGLLFKSKIGTLRELFDKTIAETINSYYPQLRGVLNNTLAYLQKCAQNKFQKNLERMGILLKKTGLKEERIEEYLNNLQEDKKLSVAILTGGDSNEKNIALLSGNHVYLQLEKSLIFDPKIYCIHKDNVYPMGYKHCGFTSINNLIENIKEEHICPTGLNSSPIMNYATFFKELKKFDFIFLGLHGGAGEDGTIQALLEGRNFKFNGVGSQLSRIFMNKYWTSLFFEEELNIKTYGRILIEHKKSRYRFNLEDHHLGIKDKNLDYKKESKWEYYDSLQSLWEIILEKLMINKDSVFIKPNNDGSSVNIQNINNFINFQRYIEKNSEIDLILVEEYISTLKDYKKPPKNKIKIYWLA